jgi:hypothetical protein
VSVATCGLRSDGVMVCLLPKDNDEAGACVPVDAPCTTGSSCCNGSVCGPYGADGATVCGHALGGCLPDGTACTSSPECGCGASCTGGVCASGADAGQGDASDSDASGQPDAAGSDAGRSTGSSSSGCSCDVVHPSEGSGLAMGGVAALVLGAAYRSRRRGGPRRGRDRR